ncbi:hypothetical protein GGH94_000860 [Coemansia aciculifera]|uniref:GH18 domain-containing protein n=1 Tax=Coemansia aciculifera TaxID=417176 RepID=A0A9W8IM71_9FUNG|nr:hypothetical protein GGH94_000860 [Coemansia aciculifera]KAJ2876530.1 hypothetical protein GGH93_000691 [Coemansia aciculifera]
MDINFNPIVNLGEMSKWREFVKLQGVKKIASFGGWAFSNELGTYAIFTDAVTDANRNLFAEKIVSFVASNNLDGVDFDWEYPGATDIPGVGGRGPNDGKNYLNFLRSWGGMPVLFRYC